MIWRIRFALLTSVVMASTLCTVRADDDLKVDDKKDPAAEKKDDKKGEAIPAPMDKGTALPPAMPGGISGSCGSPGCAPSYRTICVTEWVPEYYKTCRTTYKKECYPEKYTAYRTECVPECRTRTCTTYERVCEYRDVCKTVYDRVCCQEERTCYKPHWTCCPVTTYTCKTVDHGHYECREVPCGESFFSRMRGHGHHDSCCDPCGCGDCCNTCCVKTKTVKVWVCCKETIQVPCTHMERHCEMVPVKECVNVWKCVPRQVVCKEACWKCIPHCHTETYTCYVQKCIPYEACRMCTRCVPCTEEVTCCRMVCHKVEKQVPCCETCCNSCCNTCCETSCCHEKHSFFSRRHSCCYESCGSCGSTCGSSCGCGH